MDMDPSDNAMTYNWQPTKAQQWPPNPEVRYSGGVPIMFESGTKGTPLPSIMYGCPYPPSADGKCNVSPAPSLCLSPLLPSLLSMAVMHFFRP